MIETSITGRLGGDPEIKYFESGKVKTTFSIAKDSWNSKEKKNFTSWYTCEVWDKQAEFVGEHFKKGDPITVQGELQCSLYKEKTYYTINCKKAGYSHATMFLSGVIENIEERFSGEKRIQILKMKDIIFPVYYLGNADMSVGAVEAFTCSFDMVDYKPLVKVIRTDVSASKTTSAESTNKADSGLTESELDTIPFLGGRSGNLCGLLAS